MAPVGAWSLGEAVTSGLAVTLGDADDVGATDGSIDATLADAWAVGVGPGSMDAAGLGVGFGEAGEGSKAMTVDPPLPSPTMTSGRSPEPKTVAGLESGPMSTTSFGSDVPHVVASAGQTWSTRVVFTR
jgi:hypothetical protein